MPKSKTYDEFVEKFKPKLTTDDCYTPDGVYEAVAGFVADAYSIDRSRMVRPFWPGADYQAQEYAADAVVVDNPPFSILSKIIRFYEASGVKFFLFAPSLTLFGLRTAADLAFFPVFADVEYANGAIVRTSFVSNLEPGCIRMDSDLYRRVTEAAKACRTTKTFPKYNMPANVWNAAQMGKISRSGINMKISSKSYRFIRTLDSMKGDKKSIYGGGFIFSDGAAAVLEATLRQAEEMRRQADGSTTWQLSDRESAIIEELNETGG